MTDHEPHHRNQIQTIEATAKRWKFLQLVGALAVLAGAIGGSMEFGAEGAPDVDAVRLWAGVLIAGLAIALAGRIFAWWHHG